MSQKGTLLEDEECPQLTVDGWQLAGTFLVLEECPHSLVDRQRTPALAVNRQPPLRQRTLLLP